MSASEATGGDHARRAAVVIALVGLAAAAGLIAYVGLGKVALAFTQIGWRGILGMIAAYFVPVGILAAAWLVLAPDAKLRTWAVLYFARLVRDASGELLPFSSLGGFVFGARAAILGGVEAPVAISTTVVDVTAEFIGQLGFSALGIALLFSKAGAGLENEELLQSCLLGLGAGVLAAVLFILLQRWSLGPIERAAARWAPSALAQTSQVKEAVHELYRKPARLTISSVLHLSAWVLGGVGVWAGLWIAGPATHMSLRTIMGLESLAYVVRTITFFVPMGLGAIEGGYILVGHWFGLPAEFALAISLAKRVRDIAIGVPALAFWQILEGRRLMLPGAKKAESDAAAKATGDWSAERPESPARKTP